MVQIREAGSRGWAVLQLRLIGDDQLSGGVGGWADLPRPRRRAGIEWTGTPAFTYVLPLQLDGITPYTDLEVESHCTQLLDWGQPSPSSTEPAVLTVTGPLKAPATVRWVLENIEWGPCLRNGKGRRVQQNVTLTLKQHQRVAVLRTPAARSKKRR